MKQLIARIALNLAIWSFDLFYSWIDVNSDGKISKKELMAKAKYLDAKTKKLYSAMRKKK